MASPTLLHINSRLWMPAIITSLQLLVYPSIDMDSLHNIVYQYHWEDSLRLIMAAHTVLHINIPFNIPFDWQWWRAKFLISRSCKLLNWYSWATHRYMSPFRTLFCFEAFCSITCCNVLHCNRRPVLNVTTVLSAVPFPFLCISQKTIIKL